MLNDRRILVVEDDYLLAEALCARLRDAGAVPVGPIGWADEALEFVENPAAPFDAAVLDVDLHGERTYRVADELVRRGVPFVFATCYDAEQLESEYRRFPRCQKPLSTRMLLAALG